MGTDEKIAKHIDELIALGERVLATRVRTGVGVDLVEAQLAHRWATSTLSLLVRVFGEQSEHYKNFRAQAGRDIRFSDAEQALGVLKAAKDDFDGGHLFEVRRLVEGELFDDFLEQAEHLLESGYHQAAAVIAGAVLEDGLRKRCEKLSITLPPAPKLDSMNAELAKAGAYEKLQLKKITALAHIRNKAAHGKWTEFSVEDVKEMLPSVRRILETFLT
jgi:hypothetical protein